jgi:hypothetical protein
MGANTNRGPRSIVPAVIGSGMRKFGKSYSGVLLRQILLPDRTSGDLKRYRLRLWQSSHQRAAERVIRSERLAKLPILWPSRPGESHPEPLSEPYLNLSAHTAPAMEPRRTPICQCAHNFGSRLEIRATQCVALRK